jgi:SAM-dependent methyltransferase
VSGERENLALRTGERWRPPVYQCGTSARSRAAFAVRRYFDLQAGSIWRDLHQVVPELRGTVADVGCGAQPYRPLLDPGTTYIGIDTEDAGEDFGYDVKDVRRLDGERWPLADGEADAVLSTETLEHVPLPETFMAEARRTIRPGGRLVLTVPFAARWHYVPHDYWRYTPSTLRRLLEEAGFEDVVIWARGNALTVAVYKVMALLLPLALPPRDDGSVSVSPLAVLVGPPLAVLAMIGNWSLRQPGGDDCLGYTVKATRQRPSGTPEG